MKNWSAALQLLTVGFYVPLSLLIPTGIGFWLDRRGSHEFPVYTLIGLGIGTLIMVYGVYRMVRPFLQEAKREEKKEQVRPPITKSTTLLNSKQKKDREEG
ncbi:MAG: AtpZ/AtpI family protein [Deltaproteobacteria bacterium]|nr:AtpZ/AtpI family protein [Deltaproteobacteria bacterium]MBW2340718.1 AtpZ/AtpI family protein [Deltaproteobacteria bacterium]